MSTPTKSTTNAKDPSKVKVSAGSKKQATDRHDRVSTAAQVAKLERLEKIEQCKKKLRTTTAGLKRKIGTLNNHRLDDVLNDVYLDQDWFKARCERDMPKAKGIIKEE